KLVTGAGGSLAVTLSDNSKLTLAEQGALVIDEHTLGAGGARTRASLFGGTLRSLVNTTMGGGAGFEVHTPNAIAGVRGTDFAVAYSEEPPRPSTPDCQKYTDVAVYHG